MVEWTKGKVNEQIVKKIEGHADIIKDGIVLAIDPASRSLGWALYEKGKFIKKGTIVSKKKEVNDRLQDISAQLQTEFKDVDLLAVEKIRGSQSHDYLKWAIGMIITSIRAPRLIEVPIQFWRKLIGKDYEKTDENDAEMIGKVVITIAEDHHGKKQTRRKRQRVGRSTEAEAGE